MSKDEKKPRQGEFGNPATARFKLDDYPFYVINQVNHLYGVEVENILRRHGMERMQWQLLLILREKNPSSISELSERSGSKLSTVSRSVERMREDGLVSTAPRKSDKRVTEVLLQEQGILALDKIVEVVSTHYSHAMQGFSESEIVAFHRQLRQILANLSRSRWE